MLAGQVQAADLAPYLRNLPQNQLRSDAGFGLATDALNLRGGVTTRRIGTTTLVMPQVVSTFAVAPNLKLESRATFADWNAERQTTGSNVETGVTARSILPMIDDVEGVLQHTTTGELHRKLKLKLRETGVASLFSRRVLLRANASVERVEKSNTSSELITGIEAALVQPNSNYNGFNRIRFKYAAVSGADTRERQSMLLSHTWAQNQLLNLGVEYELTRDTAALDNTFRLSWRAVF